MIDLPSNYEATDADRMLHSACSLGDFGGVQAAIQLGANVNSWLNRNYVQPLELAVEQGDVVICVYLLDHGANVNTPAKHKHRGFDYCYGMMLKRAIDLELRDIAILLLERGIDFRAARWSGRK